jgi:hypothetical protein
MQFHVLLNGSLCIFGRVKDETGRDSRRDWKELKFKASANAEVSTATTQGPKQVGIFVGRGF